MLLCELLTSEAHFISTCLWVPHLPPSVDHAASENRSRVGTVPKMIACAAHASGPLSVVKFRLVKVEQV